MVNDIIELSAIERHLHKVVQIKRDQHNRTQLCVVWGTDVWDGIALDEELMARPF
jgi:hypothetical protein